MHAQRRRGSTPHVHRFLRLQREVFKCNNSNMRRARLISIVFLCTPPSPHFPFNLASSFHTCILHLSLSISFCVCRSCRFSQAGNTSLHLAAADGHTATAQVMVEAGANLHAIDAVR